MTRNTSTRTRDQNRPHRTSPPAAHALPDDVTPELVTALAALAQVETAWRTYRAAAADAMAAALAGGRLELTFRRRDRTTQMLPDAPADAIAAAQLNAVALAALTAAARTD